MRRISSWAAVAMILLGGCYETTVSLAPKETTVDRALVGDWKFEGESMVVRNLDNQRYYAEWSDGKERARVVAVTFPIKGALFAEARALTDDGTIPSSHTLVRVYSENGKLGLRHLKKEFFDEKSVDTPEQLRKVLEENMEKDEMYDGPTAWGERAQAATAPSGT